MTIKIVAGGVYLTTANHVVICIREAGMGLMEIWDPLNSNTYWVSESTGKFQEIGESPLDEHSSNELCILKYLSTLNLVVPIAEIIVKIDKIRRINNQMQHACVSDSLRWNCHETIDDYVHEALSLLGD